MLGKTLGNGYAITAVLGKRDIMKSAEECFISSTFWTERIGPTAAIKTLEIMEKHNSWDIITGIGHKIIQKWKELAAVNNLKIEISGIPSLANFKILSNDWIKYKTLITQDLLKKNILASNTVYSCIKHSDDLLEEYFEALNEVFKLISKCENGMRIDDLLNGPVCHSGFKRLN
jgi:Glutamate-1-semialdehyde aminotransferase